MAKKISVLRGLRSKNGMTQQALANALGVNVKQVTRWEAKEQTPSIKRLNVIVEVMDLTESDLVDLVKDYKEE